MRSKGILSAPAAGPALLLAATLAILVVSAAASTSDLDALHPGAAAFVAEMSSEHGIDAASLETLLAGAERRQDIIDAISRPAEAKPWHEYRPIFMTQRRIDDGVAFWADNAELLAQVEAEFDVPAEIIVAIIGVETSYGRITGSYRVIDALATLAFHYPPRSKFFRSELSHYLLLGSEESLPLDEIKGSYAGAMGLGQFISSSYRSYAVDFDGDGHRDLWRSRPDAIASVANYFRRHGWQAGQPVVEPAEVRADARTLDGLSIKPGHSLGELAAWGYSAPVARNAEQPATVIELEGKNGPEFWIGYQNFYVISRYNRSALYSMAVWQLSQAIGEARAAAVGP